MNKVLPGVYLGNYRDSKDTAQLERHKITHIVAIHDAARRVYPDKEYLCIMASDSPYQNLSQYFSACNDFIHTARVQGGNVLIHCLAGMSRSVTIVVAYIMSITSFQLEEAQKVVRGARPVSNPNSGFQKQLQEFESSQRLFEERRRMIEKFPGTTFLESDSEHCKRLLVSYNNLLLSRAICEGRCHSARVCPTGTCRTRYPLPSPRLSRLRSSENVDSTTQGSPISFTSPNRKLSPASSSGYLSESPTRKSPTQSHSPQSSPSTNPPWERHYGCWKEHFKYRQQQQELISSTVAARSSNSTPASPSHYSRVSKSGRSDSMISINSTISILSLPAHLQVESIPQFELNRKVSPHISSPILSPLHGKELVPDIRSCPTTPRRTALPRRQLPKTGTSGPEILRRPAPASSSPRRARMPCPPTHEEEEDETLTVVFDQPVSAVDQTSSSTTIKSWSHITTSSTNCSKSGRILPVQVSPSSSPKTGRTLPVHVSPGLSPKTGRTMLPVQESTGSCSKSGRQLPARGSPGSCSKSGRALPAQLPSTSCPKSGRIFSAQTTPNSSQKSVRVLPVQASPSRGRILSTQTSPNSSLKSSQIPLPQASLAPVAKSSRVLTTQVPHGSNISSRPSTGITRWVMKRSTYYKDHF